MERRALLEALLQTREQGISRSEKKALRAVLADRTLAEAERGALRADLVQAASAQCKDPRDAELIAWLGEALAMLVPPDTRSVPAPKVLFGPEAPMVETLVSLVQGTQRSLDVAVFTLTDDRLAEAMIDLSRRGVPVRVLTDDDKQYDRGSDVRRLEAAGIAVARDRSPHHFHHKFALFDGSVVVTGSYNWTRGADRNNRENFLVSEDPRLIRQYAQGFETMWSELA
jgi:mitochondrial cardiolipin hydrolase